jgi:ParB/RepB/Spo0J family partition protein
VEVAMQVELHQLDLKYEGLKVQDRQAEGKLVASMTAHGQLSAVVVVSAEGQAGRWVLVDGFKRVRAARRLALDVVEAMEWTGTEVEALVATHHLERSRRHTALEEAYLIRTLQEEHGLCQPEIGRLLGRSTSWVSRRLGLIKELPEWLQEHVREGTLRCHAAVKYLLPLARAKRADAETLARHIGRLSLSTRQVGVLYAAWRGGDEKSRDLVVNQPMVVLRAREEADGEGADETDSARVQQDLARTSSLLQRARRTLERASAAGMDRWDRDRMQQEWRRVQAHAALLDTRIQQEMADARPGQEEGGFRAAQGGARDTGDCPGPEHDEDDGASGAGGGGGCGPRPEAGSEGR